MKSAGGTDLADKTRHTGTFQKTKKMNEKKNPNNQQPFDTSFGLLLLPTTVGQSCLRKYYSVLVFTSFITVCNTASGFHSSFANYHLPFGFYSPLISMLPQVDSYCPNQHAGRLHKFPWFIPSFNLLRCAAVAMLPSLLFSCAYKPREP